MSITICPYDTDHGMKAAVNMFAGKNKFPPQRLILFRDGLSEGEYAKAAEKEIQAIKGE